MGKRCLNDVFCGTGYVCKKAATVSGTSRFKTLFFLALRNHVFICCSCQARENRLALDSLCVTHHVLYLLTPCDHHVLCLGKQNGEMTHRQPSKIDVPQTGC